MSQPFAPIPAVDHVSSYFNTPEVHWTNPMGVLPIDLPRRPGIPAPGDWAPRRRLGNLIAQEGVDRCECGSKHWEDDRCIDCRMQACGRRADGQLLLGRAWEFEEVMV